MRKFLSFLGGTLMGALVGATLALLLTPNSGETLRAQIRERFAALQDELSQAAAERRTELVFGYKLVRRDTHRHPAGGDG